MTNMNRICRTLTSQISRNYCSSELHKIRNGSQMQFLLKGSSRKPSSEAFENDVSQIKFLLKRSSLQQISKVGKNDTGISQAQFFLKKLSLQSISYVDKMDPVTGSKVYKSPPSVNGSERLILGVPILGNRDVAEPKNHSIVPLTEPNAEKKPKIEAHKRDKYWRRRSMKRHRYMRWRKRNEVMLKYKKMAAISKKRLRREKEIESIWKAAGLEKEPPILSEEEKRTFTEKWRYEGVWDPMSPKELYNFATPPEPKNKKVLPEHKKLAAKRKPLEYGLS